jgi:heat shock protein HslJ
MKALLLLPVLVILFASCSKSDSTSDPVADLSANSKMVSTGDWTVTQYSELGVDQSSDYSAFRFQFNSDGTFVATSADNTFSGSWLLAQGTTKVDDSGSISADDKLNKFTISVTGNKLMDKLSHKWLTDKITATEI